jgi:hypothetical protein
MNYRNLRAGERVICEQRSGGERAQMQASGRRCRRHHAFDGGIFRVGREGAFFLIPVKRPYVQLSSPDRQKG